MSDKSARLVGSACIVGILTVLFTALKLAQVIDWSWWLVLSPVLIVWAVGAFTVFAEGMMIIWVGEL